MTTYATKADILSRLALAERDEQSIPFGGVLRLRELTRAVWRACALAASIGADRVNLDLWHAHLFAAGVIDPATKAPLFTADELMALPHREDVWDEIARIAGLVMEVSEIGNNFRGSDDSEAPAE